MSVGTAKTSGVLLLLVLAGLVLAAFIAMSADCDRRGGHLARNVWGQYECVREVQGPPR